MNNEKIREALEQIERLSRNKGGAPSSVRKMFGDIAREALAQPEQRGEVAAVGEVRDMKYNTVNFYYEDRDKRSGYLQPGTKLYTAPPAPGVPDGVAKDATRYRWLREKDNASDIVQSYLHTGTGWLPRRSKLDAMIDAAMLAAAPEPPITAAPTSTASGSRTAADPSTTGEG